MAQPLQDNIKNMDVATLQTYAMSILENQMVVIGMIIVVVLLVIGM